MLPFFLVVFEDDERAMKLMASVMIRDTSARLYGKYDMRHYLRELSDLT